MRTILHDPGHGDVEVAVSKGSVTLSSGGSHVELSERQARMLHTFLHRAFPSGNQIKRDLGLLSDMPTVDREAERNRAAGIAAFQQLIFATHELALPLFEQGVPGEDWPPMLWGACVWLARIHKDMTDHGKASFLPMPDSLVRELKGAPA